MGASAGPEQDGGMELEHISPNVDGDDGGYSRNENAGDKEADPVVHKT